MDWKEKARRKHNEEKAKAKQRLKGRIIEHLQRDRTDMSGWGVGQLGISALECEVILDLYEKEKL